MAAVGLSLPVRRCSNVAVALRHSARPALANCRRLGSGGRRQVVVRISSSQAPPLKSTPAPAERRSEKRQPSGGGGGDVPKQLWRGLVKRLSNLPLALAEMGALAVLSAVGTVIEQNKSYKFYIDNYPLERPPLGFVSYQFILDTGLDHIYTTPYFLGLTVLLGASIIACTTTTQMPQLKIARKVRFMRNVDTIVALDEQSVLPSARLSDVAALLKSKDYEVHTDPDGLLYANKGILGRMAPIGVHAGLILTLVGCTLSVLCGWQGTVMAPEGSSFVMQSALRPATAFAFIPWGADREISVNSFSIDYYASGRVSQFRSDLSVVDGYGNELDRKEIEVNTPLKFGAVTAYQTDWAIAAVTARVGSETSEPVRLPMASLEGAAGFSGRIWGSFIPTGEPSAPGARPPGATVVARDLQSVALYDEAGAFVGVRRPGSNKVIEVGGVPIFIDGLTGATGLELKADPGVPLVYAGFALVMPTTFAALLTWSQVWAMQDGDTVYVGGKTNRAIRSFKVEFEEVVSQVPEYVVLPPEQGSGGAPAAGR